MSAPRLITIPASNYVEKARWALQLAGIKHVEEKHAPLFHRIATKPLGGSTVPMLDIPATNTTLLDSSQILDFCAQTMPSLYPNPNVKELELFYDTKLGPHVRRVAYRLLFTNKDLTKRLIIEPIDGLVERNSAKLLFPLFVKPLMIKGFSITEERGLDSLNRIEKLVEEANQKLGEGPIGSQFIAGDTFSAADITFCAHMSLLLNPPEHIYFVSFFDFIKNHPLRERIEKIQKSKAGQFVYWCYKHKRPAMLSPTPKL